MVTNGKSGYFVFILLCYFASYELLRVFMIGDVWPISSFACG
jgi:hypothetical protein